MRQVEEAGFWLETYRQGVEADPLRVYQMVDRLDELVQSHRLTLTREYLRAGGASRPTANGGSGPLSFIWRASWRPATRLRCNCFRPGPLAHLQWLRWCL